MALSDFAWDLARIEEEAHKHSGHILSDYLIKLVNRVRELDHELNHPNYMYASGRIGRSALVSRQMEIENLRAEVKKMAKELEEERKKLCQKQQPANYRCKRKDGHDGPCACEPIIDYSNVKRDLHDRS